jgi:hypothetical protein
LRVGFQRAVLFGFHCLFAAFGARLSNQLLYRWHLRAFSLSFSNINVRMAFYLGYGWE